MIIGIDASRANQAQKTGTEWYSYNLIQELKKIIPQDYKVYLYTKDTLKGELAQLPNNWQEKKLSWPFIFLWTQIRFSLEMLKFWSRPDILFVPAHTIPLIHPKKTILVAHDIGFEKFPELYSDKKIGFSQATELDYHRWAMRFAIKHAYHIITVSNFSKNEIINFYRYNASKISVAYNGFNKISSKDNNPDILTKYNIKRPYLLFIGRLEYKKNIPRLIEAFNILKNKYQIKHKLILLGTRSFKYELIKNNIDKFNLRADVIEPGYVGQKDISTIMHFADLFILPSLYEGFGIPVLEAMAAGIPVACSDIPPLKEIAQDAAVYFNPVDKDNMANTIYKILNNYSLKQKIINNGNILAQKYSYEKCAQETWKIICQMVICKNN